MIHKLIIYLIISYTSLIIIIIIIIPNIYIALFCALKALHIEEGNLLHHHQWLLLYILYIITVINNLHAHGWHGTPGRLLQRCPIRVIESAVSRWVGRWLGQSNCLLLNYLMECENQRRRVTGSRSARSSPAAQGENAPQTRHCAGQDLLRGQDTGNELLLKRSC